MKENMRWPSPLHWKLSSSSQNCMVAPTYNLHRPTSFSQRLLLVSPHTHSSHLSAHSLTHTYTHTPTGLGRLAEADQYLSQAQWSVLKSPNCDPWLRSQLHRNLGQLAAAKNSLTEARRHFAEDVSTSQSACLCTTSGLKRVQLNIFSRFVAWMVPSLLDLPTVIAVSIVPVRMVVVSVSVC